MTSVMVHGTWLLGGTINVPCRVKLVLSKCKLSWTLDCIARCIRQVSQKVIKAGMAIALATIQACNQKLVVDVKGGLKDFLCDSVKKARGFKFPGSLLNNYATQ